MACRVESGGEKKSRTTVVRGGPRERREDESARRYKKDIKGRGLSSRFYVSVNRLIFSQSSVLLN